MFEAHADDKILREEVMGDFRDAEREHKLYEPGWTRYHALYRSYRDLTNRVRENDRDTRQRLTKRQLDEDLFIPLVFATMETMMPRVISNLPRPTIGPRHNATDQDIRSVRWLIEDQLDRANYDLIGQKVAKAGFGYGLGVQKTFWEKEVQKQPVIEKGAENPWVINTKPKTLSDDATVESVNVKDWFWQPGAYNIKTCDYAVHRLWRSTRYVMAQFRSGNWKARKQDGTKLEGEELLEVVKELNSSGKYSETWSDHDTAAGLTRGQDQNRAIHEVLEYHDGTRCVHILDREIICFPGEKAGYRVDEYTAGKNPYWHGQLPFQIYRPIPDLDDNNMVGVSLIEQQEPLQEELITIRTERRWNAAMAVNAPFFYMEGMLDPNQIKWGPGIFNPVRGNPNELLQQFQARDVPSSGYQEEQSLLSDNERVTGLSDAQQGVRQSGDTTATEAQLVAQSTSLTVQFRAKILVKETMKPMIGQMVRLNQQKVRTERPVYGPQAPGPGESVGSVGPVGMVGPEQLQGDWNDIQVDPEQIQPANGPANQERARELWQNFGGNPLIDQNALARRVLDLYGEKKPDELVAPPEPRISPMTLQLLADAGVPPEMIDEAMNRANQAEADGQPPEPIVPPEPSPPNGQQPAPSQEAAMPPEGGPLPPDMPVGPDGMPPMGPDGMPMDPSMMQPQPGMEMVSGGEIPVAGEVVPHEMSPHEEKVMDDLEQLKAGLEAIVEEMMVQPEPVEGEVVDENAPPPEPQLPPEINLSITVNNEPGEAPIITAQTDLNAPPRTFEVERDKDGNPIRYREVSQEPDEAA